MDTDRGEANHTVVAILAAVRRTPQDRHPAVAAILQRPEAGSPWDVVAGLMHCAVALAHEIGWQDSETLAVHLSATADETTAPVSALLARDMVISAVQRAILGDPGAVARTVDELTDLPVEVQSWSLDIATTLAYLLLVRCVDTGVPVPVWLLPAV